MNATEQNNVLLIGVGNDLRGDDALGRAVVRRLKGTPGVRVLEENGEGADLMTAWDGAKAVIVVDAVESGAGAGTVYRFDAETGPLPADLFQCSTHAFGVASAIELARVLGNLPPRLIVYGIEGGSCEPGEALSPDAARAVEFVAGEIRGDIERLKEGLPCTSFH